MKVKALGIAVVIMGGLAVGQAQTTLSGNHIITGNLDVGTSGTNGNLLVTGQTGTNASPGIKVTGDGGVLFQGTLGTGKIPATGTGTRFMWYPKKAALRVGTISTNAASTNFWDDANIGTNSFAFGTDAKASGENSFAVNGRALGSNSISIAGGKQLFYYSEAFGTNAVAVGNVAASGSYSVAIGSGGGGTFSTASNAIYIATKMGGAWGAQSIVIGEGYAYSPGGIIVGSGTANGSGSAIFGKGLIVNGMNSVAIGSYNKTRANENTTNWVGTNTVFVVGNGSGNTNDATNVRYSDALVIYKNGAVQIPKRQGDILMGEFGNGGGD